MSDDTEKLQKVLARIGLGSRREMERWIADGRVSVDGQIATLGDRVTMKARIRVDGNPIRLPAALKTRVIIYNKPESEVCTRDDPEERPTVFDNLPRLPRGRWVAVGRLDINTTGLLVFTNDGELANKLMHPSSEIEREYAVRVLGDVDQMMLARLKRGVMLDDGKAHFEEITHAGGEGANQWYHVTICEGRQREVRRLWESQDVKVSRLIRIRYGNVLLPRDLPRGTWDELDQSEIDELNTLFDE